jgi:flagellar hook-length control protein FliK
MQINIDFNLLNSIMGNTNTGQSLVKETMDFEKLILNSLGKQDSNIEGDVGVDTKDIDISEEEISELLGLLNQMITRYENLETKEDYVINIKNSDLDVITRNEEVIKKELNILDDIANNDSKKSNLISSFMKKLDSIDQQALIEENAKLDSLVNKLIKQYGNKETTGINNALKELRNELNKISSSYSFNVDKQTDSKLNENHIPDIKNARLDLITNNRETPKKELDILDEIANNDDFGRFNFNSLDKKINNNIKQVNIEQPTYKTIEHNVVQDTIKNIEYMKLNNIQELNVSLNPKELGKMNIKLLQENDGMKAILTVHSKDIFDLVNKNISDIKEHLENINVNIKDITIKVQSDNTYRNENFERNFSNNQNTREQRNKNDKKNLNMDSEELKENIKEDNINLLA